MKKKTVLLSLLLVLLPALVMASDVAFKWDATPWATGYQIQMSIDLGATWGAPVDVKNVLAYTWLGAPDDKLVLFRISAYDTSVPPQTVTNAWSGTWWDGRKLHLPAPKGLRQ